jgi:hypothetical protein
MSDSEYTPFPADDPTSPDRTINIPHHTSPDGIGRFFVVVF